MPIPESLVLIGTAFLLAGVIKGVLGFGLPTVTLALLVTTIGLKEAMVLLIIPCFVTNLWQTVSGGHFLSLLGRLWTILLGVFVASWLGAVWHATTDPNLLIGLLGALLCLYAVWGLKMAPIPAPGRHETWLSPLTGVISGILNGLTGSFVIPGVMYLQSLDLPRDALIQAMGLLFTVSIVALGFAFSGNGLLDSEYVGLSAVAVVPALVGMQIGLGLRHRLNASQFKRTFFGSLLVFGIYFVINPLL